jgi:hypothetical protein
MKRQFLVLLAATLLCVGVTSLRLMAVAPKPSLEPMAGADAASADHSVDTSAWKTYRNEKQAFELKYPETWIVNVGSGTTEIVVISKPHREGELKASLTLAIQINQNPKKLRIEDWFGEQLKLIHTSPESTGRTTIGGQDAVFMENTNSLGKQRATFTLLHATDVLSLSYKRQAELDDTYTAMTSSFRVID